MTELLTINSTPISSLCFGTMQFGGASDFKESELIFNKCREVGINFFDTAHSYNQGRSEEILGALCQRNRDELLLGTKAAYDNSATKKNILKSFEKSRKRLNTDFIDILYMHRWDPSVPIQETIECLAELIGKRLIRYIGVSNYAAWQVMKAKKVATDLGFSLDVIQPMYSLVKRQAEVELLPMSAEEKIAVCPYSPLGGGLLTGKYIKEGVTGRLTSDSSYKQRYALEWMHQTAEKLLILSKTYDISPVTLAIAWVSKNSYITTPIISAKTIDQLQPSLDVLNYKMSDELYNEMTHLSLSPAPATDRLEET